MSLTAKLMAAAAGGGALALIAMTGQVDPDRAHCKLGGDYPASIIDTATGEVLTADDLTISRDRKTCLQYIGNDFLTYQVR